MDKLVLRGFFEENVVQPAVARIDFEAYKRIGITSGMHNLPIEEAKQRLGIWRFIQGNPLPGLYLKTVSDYHQGKASCAGRSSLIPFSRNFTPDSGKCTKDCINVSQCCAVGAD